MTKPSEIHQPTPVGEVILERLETMSLSMAEIERRSGLSKNTIANAIYGPRTPQRKTIEILAETLELPVEALTRPRRVSEVRFETFSEWLFRVDNPSLWIALGGTILTAVLGWLSLGTGSVSPAIHTVHFLVILALVTRLPRAIDRRGIYAEPSRRLRFALAAAADLRRYWGLAWTSWLFLYLGLAAAALLAVLPTAQAPVSPEARWLVIGLNLTQNAGTVMLFLAYEVVSRPTLEDDFSRRQLLPLEAWLCFALLLTTFESASLLAGLGWSVQQWFGWIGGFAQGTALALLVGRLDSRYIDSSPPVIACLYVYACIQGAWPVLQWNEQLMLALTFLALVLKCLLFLFFAWLFESRVVFFFLERLRKIDEGAREERRRFLSEFGSSTG
ncbi:MAG: helix-turn-helix domain-containing protein [Thermoanaerobaculia bacterium]|nr:helix-turn-helix domain-containing protein [Thermoanaerobaculia bacterium]